MCSGFGNRGRSASTGVIVLLMVIVLRGPLARQWEREHPGRPRPKETIVRVAVQPSNICGPVAPSSQLPTTPGSDAATTKVTRSSSASGATVRAFTTTGTGIYDVSMDMPNSWRPEELEFQFGNTSIRAERDKLFPQTLRNSGHPFSIERFTDVGFTINDGGCVGISYSVIWIRGKQNTTLTNRVDKAPKQTRPLAATHRNPTIATQPPPRIDLPISVLIDSPSDPAITVENLSDSVVDGVGWELVMFRTSDQAFLSYARQNIGYVKPHSKSARYSMQLNTLPRAPGGDQIVDGDNLIGTLSVDCPTCKGNTLIVSFIWGKSGWFCDVPQGNGRLLLPKDMSKDKIIQFIETLNTISKPEERTLIASKTEAH